MRSDELLAEHSASALVVLLLEHLDDPLRERRELAIQQTIVAQYLVTTRMTVDRHPGQCPVVTILAPSESPDVAALDRTVPRGEGP